MTYPEYPADAVALELEVLRRWKEEDLFRRTLEATAGREEFVFFEGPPTANGRPGLHHVLSRTIKDLFCRYQTMRGKHVTRIAGWDTHGLPVEIEAEKKLGISGKREIEDGKAVFERKFQRLRKQPRHFRGELWIGLRHPLFNGFRTTFVIFREQQRNYDRSGGKRNLCGVAQRRRD